MRIIAIGCEYSGVTTLLDGLHDWGQEHGVNFHMDDHFTIPDAYHLSTEEQHAMLDMLPAIKERFQRFQIVYHVRLINNYEHILLGGFHLEEEVYGPLYYYPGLTVSDTRKYESEMPDDAILVHLHARPEIIAKRLKESPHAHTLIDKDHIPMLLGRFAEEFRSSWIHNKFAIATSDLNPTELLATFFEEANPHFNTRDAILLLQNNDH